MGRAEAPQKTIEIRPADPTMAKLPKHRVTLFGPECAGSGKREKVSGPGIFLGGNSFIVFVNCGKCHRLLRTTTHGI
jgi:hypothetical protein